MTVNRLLTQRFRRIAFLEGVSFVVLLGIAMPLKYFADLPLAVRIVGMAHGVLFIVYALMVLGFLVRKEWPFDRAAEAMGWSVVPFGTFVLDRQLRQDLSQS